MTTAVAKDKTKNASSYRSFPLLPEARQIFLAALNAEQENRRLCGKDYQQNPYVFKWPDGRPFSPDYVSHHFAALLHKHGLPHIRFHELRHSCASLLLANDVPLKQIQEWLGHSDISTTANIYSHLDYKSKLMSANVMDNVLTLPETEAVGWQT